MSIRDSIIYKLICDPEEIPVHGNVSASGDDAEDRRMEDDILCRLNSGDQWAWFNAHVVGIFGDLEAHDYLGGCSYDSEEDFKKGGYWDDMKSVVADDIEAQISSLLAMIPNEALQAHIKNAMVSQ